VASIGPAPIFDEFGYRVEVRDRSIVDEHGLIKTRLLYERKHLSRLVSKDDPDQKLSDPNI